jgi:hypothetical protein
MFQQFKSAALFAAQWESSIVPPHTRGERAVRAAERVQSAVAAYVKYFYTRMPVLRCSRAASFGDLGKIGIGMLPQIEKFPELRFGAEWIGLPAIGLR